METKNTEQEEGGKQIALWAYKLTINHPVTKEEMSFKVLPEINRNLGNNRRIGDRII